MSYTATRPFTPKELEDLEKVCGLHVNHLLLFMESVINQVKTQENVVFWNNEPLHLIDGP